VDQLALQKDEKANESEQMTKSERTLEEIKPPVLQQQDPLEICKAQITTVVTRKSELKIYEEQLRELLANLFNLKNVKFCVDGGRLTGVYLFEEVVA